MNWKEISLTPYQFAAIFSGYEHFAFYAGVGSGKSFTGSHFALHMFESYPHLRGFIGANDHNQLSQVTLQELFYWLNEYHWEFVIDRIPPREWGEARLFKSYSNILTVRNPETKRVSYAFTRITSEPDPLRGLEFSWYWLDELRDTQEYAHDMILGRMREDQEIIRGLVTTTTNGESWDYKRFVLGRRKGDRTYGSMHVPSTESVKYGVITQKYLNLLLKSYSPLMAEQEIYARHVNVKGGRAYYSASERNRKRVAPWGESRPNPQRPLIIGADFNFSPAPCVWMVGQLGPPEPDEYGGLWSDHIHWFGEIARTEASTPEMTRALVAQFPGFFYEVFGDMSGNRGTTSNAGITDFQQLSITMADLGQLCSVYAHQIDESQSRANPWVKDRVENMNAKFCNALGEVHQTYNPDTCPLFDGDMKMVGWKTTTNLGRGKLDDAGDKDRTHASDGGGYAVFIKLPPGRRATIIDAVPSAIRQEFS